VAAGAQACGELAWAASRTSNSRLTSMRRAWVRARRGHGPLRQVSRGGERPAARGVEPLPVAPRARDGSACGSSALSLRAARISSAGARATLRGGIPPRVHAHVERPSCWKPKPAPDRRSGIEETPRSRTRSPRPGPPISQHSVQRSEIRVPHEQDALVVTQRAQTRLALRQLDRIDVEGQQPPAGREALEHSFGVSTPAERTVDAALPRTRREYRQQLLGQDRHVLSRRSLAPAAHVRDELGVLLGRVLLVLLLEPPRVRAAVAWPAAVRRGDVGGGLGHVRRAIIPARR
jgi:hypothetical protein